MTSYNPKKIEAKWPRKTLTLRRGLRPRSQGASLRGKSIYSPRAIESKWSKIWEKEKTFKVDLQNAKKPFYNLAMFPYPSGEGLHMGHIIPYSGVDTYGRFLRMNGYDVFEPMGFDAFGIHSENFAIKKGVHPKTLIAETTTYFREKQMKRLGTLFDWDHEVNTTDPDYYKWTQWLFIQMFKAGLAEKKKAPVTYCPSCKTVLSDEQTEIRKMQNTPHSNLLLKEKGIKGKIDKQLPSPLGEGEGEVSVTVCERCKTPIERREMEQWFFKITKYADKLLSNLDHINWSEKTKRAQRNWIGKSEGINITYDVVDERGNKLTINNDQCTITCFTTRPDTNFGATFLVLAPEHEFVTHILSKKTSSQPSPLFPSPLGEGQGEVSLSEIQAYVFRSQSKTEQERIAEGRDKTGVFTGFYALNNLNGKKIPIWISDFVLPSVGTGAVVGVPAHDERDFAFAKKFDLQILPVVVPSLSNLSNLSNLSDLETQSSLPFEGEGICINSDFLNGLSTKAAKEKIMDYLEKKGWAKRVTSYKLRDWCISRQRYWGPPIPMIFCQSCANNGEFFRHSGEEPKATTPESTTDSGQARMTNLMSGWFPVPEADLPVILPFVRDYKPSGDGKSPLAKDKKWMKVECPNCNSWAERETDVSDTFLDSAWYFLRYPSVGISYQASAVFPSPLGEGEGEVNIPWDPEVTRNWLPVDMYIGGNEHAVLHLMYSRFITMALKDMGHIDFEEPFKRFFAHGLLLSEGAKMSKSRGNVVNPNVYLDKYGADTLRMYILFLGPYDAGGDFRATSIAGMYRFLTRVWTLVINNANFVITEEKVSRELLVTMHKTIKKVTEDLKLFHFNTAIAAIMEYYNELFKIASFSKSPKSPKSPKYLCAEWQEAIKTFLILLAPFAPFITEELWQAVQSFPKSPNSPKFPKSIHSQSWPQYDEKILKEEKVTMIIQINGKIKDKMELDAEIAKNQTEVEKLALDLPRIKSFFSLKTPISRTSPISLKPRKTIFLPGKLINFVV